MTHSVLMGYSLKGDEMTYAQAKEILRTYTLPMTHLQMVLYKQALEIVTKLSLKVNNG